MAMKVIQGIDRLEESVPRSVVTIGNFDGVHEGHRAIVDVAKEKANLLNCPLIGYTFRPHPRLALNPGRALPLLTTYDEKLELLGGLGIDMVVEEPFSREFSTVRPESFFTDILLRRLNAAAIVVGYDFGFGKDRSGSLELLRTACESSGVELVVVEPQRVEGEIVSSSVIRQYMGQGDLRSATRLLGRSFFYRGIVVRGKGRGRQIGFPTANLQLKNKFTLPYGVYSSYVFMDGSLQPSVTNVGVRPTFEAIDLESENQELPALVETYILDKDIDLYGKEIEVRFVEKLRDEMKFAGVEELIQQIQKDVDIVRSQLRS